MLYKCAIESLCIMFFFFLPSLSMRLHQHQSFLQSVEKCSAKACCCFAVSLCYTWLTLLFNINSGSCWSFSGSATSFILMTMWSQIFMKLSADSPCSCLCPLNLDISNMTLHLLKKCSTIIVHQKINVEFVISHVVRRYLSKHLIHLGHSLLSVQANLSGALMWKH